MIRALATGIRLYVVQFTRSGFDLSGVVLWPFLYAAIADYLLDAKHEPNVLLSASLGAAVMTMWSMVAMGSSGALENQRWLGTLELLVASPTPLAVAIAPITIAYGIVGAYSLAATLACGALFFGVPITIDDPLAFAVAIPLSALAIGMLGLMITGAFVLYRAATFLGVATQYPVWIASGLLVPLSVLPAFVRPISWFLAPTWGFRAIRNAALPGDPWPDIVLCIFLTGAYFLVSVVLLRVFEKAARSRATLRLT
jgi:ABC-2 type transport system permease protein